MCKISIVVPVYNTQAYLPQCLNSIKEQSFKDFEVLLINDGSTDSSGSICDDFVAKNSRFRVFHQENKGIGYVRNFGILNARGTYIIHIDSDDYVESNFLEALYSKIEMTQADIAFCDFIRFSDDYRIVDVQQISLKTENIIVGILNETHFSGLWNKLIKRSIFVENNIQIDTKLKLWEDVIVLIEVLLHAEKVVYVNKALYNYRFVANSISNFRSKDSFLSSFLIVDKLSEILPHNGVFQEALTEFKLQIRRDILLHGQGYNLPSMYPETNYAITKSDVLTSFQKFALTLEKKRLSLLLRLLLKARLSLKKIKN